MASNRLHKGTILSHEPAGRGYYRLVLKAPDAAAAALPGHFVMLRVSQSMIRSLRAHLALHQYLPDQPLKSFTA